MKKITCAFCKGTGKDPFCLLSERSACQVCGGAGVVAIMEPAIPCAFCRGTGVHPHGARVTCTVCNGKGKVSVSTGLSGVASQRFTVKTEGASAPGGKGAMEACSKCKGTGMGTDSGLPCLTCGGKGVVSKK